MAIVWLSGFDHQFNTPASWVLPSGAGSGTGQGYVNAQVSGALANLGRNGGWCADINASAATKYIEPVNLASNTHVVANFWLNFPTLPTADFIVCDFFTGDYTLVFTASDNKIRFGTDTGVGYAGFSQGPVLSASTWYHVEFYINAATGVHKWYVDGTARTDFSGGTSAVTQCQFGTSDQAQTGRVLIDDAFIWADTATITGFPFGKHKAVLLKPDTAATATQIGTVDATSTFTANGTIGTTFNSANLLSFTSEVPPLIGASASGFTQRTLSTTSAAEVPMTTYALQAGESIAGARLVIVGWSGSATANSLGVRSWNGATETVLFATADPNFDNSTTAPGMLCKMLTLADIDTQAELDALAIRIGYSGDVTPNPGAHAIYVEALIKESTGAAPSLRPRSPRPLLQAVSRAANW